MSKKKNLPKVITDLAYDPANPREISTEAAAGLAHSLSTFGDLSGITFNLTTQQLVAGHQRVQQIFNKYAPLPIEFIGDDLGRIVTPAGAFPVRFVRWDLDTQHAAGVAANSPTISGRFVEDRLELILGELREKRGTDFESMYFEHLFGVDTREGAGGTLKDQPVKEPPKMAWVLIGMPIKDYTEIDAAIAELAKNPKVVMSITANDG